MKRSILRAHVDGTIPSGENRWWYVDVGRDITPFAAEAWSGKPCSWATWGHFLLFFREVRS